MNGKFAKWSLIQLLTIIMVFAAGSAFAAGEALLHNSQTTGSTKWGGSWGVAGGQYGEFTCTTCHSSTTTGPNGNIKKIVSAIPDTIGPNVNKPVTFNNMTGFGDDAGGHLTSARICEVCHTQTTVHRYDTTGQADLDHKGANQTDCTTCHAHADGFKGKGCTSCHGSTAASSNPIITGQHTAHIANAVYGCADCHAKSVTSDSDIKSAPTAHQNSTYGDYSGARAGGSYAAGVCSNVYCHTDGKGGAPAIAVNWATGPALDCKGCHGAGGSYGEPAYVGGNSHATHVSSAADCVSCHYATTADGTTIKPGGSHTNTSIDVDGSSSIGFDGGAKTCSSASCHADPYSSGSATTPAWGTSAGCSACHGAYPITANGPATGSHTTVAGHAVACITCHAAGTTATAKPSTGHADGDIDVANVGYATLNKTKGTAGTTCSNASCHANPYAVGGYVTTPAWGSIGNGCAACHTGANVITANGPATGSHTAHAGKACTSCHAAGTTATTAPTIGHNDTDIDITVGSYPATAKHAAGSGYSNCSNVSCHSGSGIITNVAAAQWGATLGCDGCHGYTSTANLLSGKHQKHVSATVALNCNQCHRNGGINNSKANHLNSMINYSSQWAGTITLADGKCNNVYCHSNGKGVFVNMTNANWFSARTLDCKSCHGGAASQAGEPSYANGGIENVMANNHPQHVGTINADTTCQNCHRKTVTGIFLNATTHNVSFGGYTQAIPYHVDKSNGDVNAGVYAGNGKTFSYTAASKTCSNISCHSGNGIVTGVGAAQWGAALNCDGCHGGNAAATNKITTGQHVKHTDQTGIIGVNFGCIECHAQTVTNDTTLAAGNTHMNALANFSGAKAGKNKAACTAAYCHSNGKGDAGATTVSWTTGPALDCKGCHGGASSQAGEPVYTTTAPGTLKTNSHPKHVGTTGADTTCQNCHGSTMNVALLSNSGNHLNGSINVIQGSDSSKSFTYSNDSSKTCSNIDCHSGNGMFTSNPIQWGATMPTDCTGCHANDVTAAALSGAHNAHINNASAGGNFRCKDCHAPTITNSDNRTIADANNHGNTIINYSGAKAGKNKNCSNIYCHSNGKGVFAAIPAWVGGSASCQSCHATGALLVDHGKHIAKGATCAQCHNATTSDSATITGSTHIDGTVNLQQSGTLFNGKAVSFAPSGTTCNNISCHSPYGSSTASATWGVAATCETCHPEAGLSGAHQVHIGALDLTSGSVYYNMTANRTPAVAQVSETDRKHGFGCAECHPMDPASHLNGAINVDMNRVNVAGVGSLRFLNASSAIYDMAATKKCSNIYCHSNASRLEAESNVKANTSLAWTDTFAAHPELDRCAACHGNQPTTGAHAAHSVGIHTFNEGPASVLGGNIFNGKSGKVPITNKANTAHGNPDNSTTISCYICHNLTVTSKANDKNDRCFVCHVNGSYNATAKGLGAISNLKNHVNGSREIAFLPVQVLSKAQIRPKGPNKNNSTFDFYSATWTRTSYKNMSTLSFDRAKVALTTAVMWHYSSAKESNCSNIACHNGKLVKWNLDNFHDPNKCMDCHNAL